MFKKIDHAEIVTEQLDRAVQFYTDVLGFKVRVKERIDRSSLGVSLDLVYLDLGGTAIELIAYGGPVAPAPTQEHLGYRMMALEVTDMQTTIDYLKTKNVPVTWGPRVREGEYARAEIRDPDGHSIELRHWFGRR
jgi:catechol 2,3-dioxygenase-like lactoylglutathione lyase family enzyme